MVGLGNMKDIRQILDLAIPNINVDTRLPILQEIEKSIPGSVQNTIKRFEKKENIAINDSAVFTYHFHPNNPEKNHLELKFCISGNFYCNEKRLECDFCKLNSSEACKEKIASIDVVSFSFSPSYLHQFAKVNKNENSLSDKVVAFTHKESFTKSAPLNEKTKLAIHSLLNHNFSDSIENIFINAQTQIILLYTTELMFANNHSFNYQSKFLANQEDRNKIIKAREILLEHIHHPITIKTLSRKVAINECYLKKGFKEIFGTTIFDFYQSQRMEHAKYLLYEKKLSVTEVSASLGYSSISHFSTAFKKHTGIKPCELLLPQIS